MRLEKFYAGSMSEALAKIQEKFGADAVIYSQNSTDKGIEVVAGIAKQLSNNTGISPIEKNSSIDSLNILEKFAAIDHQSLQTELQRIEKINLLQQKLRKLKFAPDFIEYCSDNYAVGCDKESILNNEIIIKILLSKIPILENEIIDSKKICALIGPTGIGKSTTVAKLAKRFISKYGSRKLGIISTDFQRIITKNQFHYFGKLLNIQIEYARNANELKEAIHVFDKKQLTLIDTAGISPSDNRKLAELLDNPSNEIKDIATYLVLPCNLQSDILDEVVQNFRMSHTLGCIMTKKDECKSIAPCLSIVMNHQLPIAYWCNGQNISKDIHTPNKIQLINAVFHGEKSEQDRALQV